MLAALCRHDKAEYLSFALLSAVFLGSSIVNIYYEAEGPAIRFAAVAEIL